VRPFRIIFLYLLVTAFLFKACTSAQKETDAERTKAKYGIIVFAGEEEDEEYLLTTDSLSGGFLKIRPDAEKIYSLVSAYGNGYFYGIDDGKPKFTRYIPTDKGLITDVEIPFHQVAWNAYESWYNWIDDNTILLGSSMDGHRFTYSIIDVKSMKIVKSGDLDIPQPADDQRFGGVLGVYRDNRLFVGYTHHTGWQSKKPSSDTTFLAVIEYPSMKTLKIETDTRSTSPGGLYLHATYSMQENGDIYFLAAPGERTHRHHSAKTALYRIRKGTETLDKEYFFEIGDADKEGYMLYPLGEGKALIKMIERKKVKQYMDYLGRGVADYYLLDIHAQTKTKLDLPADVLGFTENVLVDNGMAYIGVTEKKNESYVWEYNIKTGSLKKGLKVEGKALIIKKL
jgi:hypothetical protein